MKTMKQKLLIVPTQLGGQNFREYKDMERKTLVELVEQVRREPLVNLHKYYQINFLVIDMNKLRRPFLTKLVLKWSAKHVQIKDLRGAQFRLSWFGIVKSGFHLLNELFLIRQVGSQALRDVKKTDGFSGRMIGSLSHGDIIYVKGGQGTESQAGGSITHVAGVANSFCKMGYNVDYWGSIYNPLLHQDIPQHILNSSLRFPNFLDVENVLKNSDLKMGIIQAGNIKKPAFVYQRYSRYTYVGLSVAQHFNVPLVLEFNSFTGRSWSVGLKFPELAGKVQDLMLSYSTLIVVVSKVLKDQLEDRGIGSDRILINPNGVDVNRFSPQIDGCEVRKRFGLQNKKVIGFIGTFAPWHGAQVLAKAIKQIPDKNLKDVIFLFMGDGQSRTLTQEIIKKEHREPFCIFTGMVPQQQSPNYLAACDLLVSPHVDPEGIQFYGSPTKLFEYMAMGKGIIASRLEQIGDVLEDGETAFLVPPGDAEALAGAIVKALKSPDLCASLGINARRGACKDHTWERNAKNVIEALRQITQTNSGTSIHYND